MKKERGVHFWIGWVVFYPARVFIAVFYCVAVTCTLPTEWEKEFKL